MRALLLGSNLPLGHTLKRRLERSGVPAELAGDPNRSGPPAPIAACQVIILDLGPPEGDGLSLLTHCRQSGIDLPILVLTEDGVRETVAALDAGADACMPKPFSLDELLARLRSLNRRGQVWADTRIRVHDLEINTGTHTVCRAGREIRLTPREYALLEFLALRPGKVLSRSMILEQVYHEGKMARSNVVDVYIRYLRKKVDKGFTLPLILTARGAGYLLRGE